MHPLLHAFFILYPSIAVGVWLYLASHHKEIGAAKGTFLALFWPLWVVILFCLMPSQLWNDIPRARE